MLGALFFSFPAFPADQFGVALAVFEAKVGDLAIERKKKMKKTQ